MKYDRPVWQLMYGCAAAMPDPFRYEDVHRWFGRLYPDIGQATIRAHLVGMCEGGRPKQPQFASRAAIFRRVARGMYEVIPEGERKIDPDLPPADEVVDADTDLDPFAASAFDDATVVEASTSTPTHEDGYEGTYDVVHATHDSAFADMIERSGLAGDLLDVPDPTAESADVLLLASDGERVLVPAPAREIYRAESFQSARLRAQSRGTTWFVLSAEHGLLEPAEWVSPDSRSLADLDPHYRQVWAQWVLARLESLDGPVDGRRVHIVAPHSYVGPLAAVLQDGGAEVTFGAAPHAGPSARTIPRAPVEDRPAPAPPVVEDRSYLPPAAVAGRDHLEALAADAPLPAVAAHHAVEDTPVDEREVAAAVAHLADRTSAVPPQQLDGIQDVPGLFAWHVDADGARVLNRSLMLPVGEGVLHVGHAGATGRAPDAVSSLRFLVQGVQLRGHSRASTFRASLATILREPLRLRTLDDPALTAWMERHLTVVTWPTTDREGIQALAHWVVADLEPPLNVDHLRASEMRHRLGELRRSQG